MTVQDLKNDPSVDPVCILARLRAWLRHSRIPGVDLAAIGLDLGEFQKLIYTVDDLNDADWGIIQRVVDCTRVPSLYLRHGDPPSTLSRTQQELLKSYEVTHEFVIRKKEITLDRAGRFIGEMFTGAEQNLQSERLAVYLVGLPQTVAAVGRKYAEWERKQCRK